MYVHASLLTISADINVYIDNVKCAPYRTFNLKTRQLGPISEELNKTVYQRNI